MKKIIFLTISIFVFGLALPTSSFAQGMSHTAREEAEGKAVWEKLQAKELTCKDLFDDNFGALGEYFMGQSIGDDSRHIAMNEMMKGMMGEQGEEQMHIAMGKRMSNCEPNAPIPQNMMNMMMGNFGTNPASWLGLGFGWVFMISFWVLIVLGIIALIKWIIKK